ncbi:MAG: hypothetical protein RL481_2449 [Pseudomonadota bacterium]|jgi:hypothetical protein
MKLLGRRQFIRRAMATAIGATAVAAPISRAFADATSPVPSPQLLKRALAAFEHHGHRIWQRRTIGIADFSMGSALPRFHLFNVEDGQSLALLVAHGKGSDPEHSGYVHNFSNQPGSEATSSGAYLTGEGYVGKYGLSRRLIGLDPENNMAEARAIVIHPAWYVSETIASEQGKVGRSQGCFAFAEADIGQALSRLPPGSLIYADKL